MQIDCKMHLWWILILCVVHCEGKTLQLNTSHASKLNLRPNFKSVFQDAMNVGNVWLDTNRPNAVDNEVISGNYGISKDVGKDMRILWEYFTDELRNVQSRISKIEAQTSEILQRLSMIDCSSLPGNSSSGVYTLYLDSRGTHSVRVQCEMEKEGGGWTVVLNRIPHTNLGLALNFSRGLRDYKVGFGDPDGDFWIGLENLHLLTSYRDYQLRVDLVDFNGDTAFAHYDKFYLEDERNGYRLQASGYRGNAGDSLTNKGNYDNYTAAGMMFSTHDEDRDTSHEINCSQYWGIGGWWFNRCSWANLMGPYKIPSQKTAKDSDERDEGIGINWHKWRNKKYLKSATMMIRPAKQ